MPGKVLRRSPWHASWWRVGPTLDAGAAPAASKAPITLALITSLTGKPARNSPMRPRGSADTAMRTQQGASTATRSSRSSSITRRVRPRSSPLSKIRYRRGPWDRVGQSALLRGGQVPTPARDPGQGWEFRRARMGRAALHEHVRFRHGQRGSEVPGQLRDRRLSEGARGNDDRHLRVQHCPRRRGRPLSDRPVVPRRGQGGGGRHVGSFGSVDLTTQALVAKQKVVDTVYAGMDNNTNFALAKALRQAGVKVKALVFPTGSRRASSTRRCGSPSKEAFSRRRSDRRSCRTRPRSSSRPRSRSISTGPRRTSRTSSPTSPGSGPT